MTSIPPNLARVPNMLASQTMLNSLSRTSTSLLNTQVQLTSGKAVSRPSDDVVASSTIGALDSIIERREQRLRNLSHADAMLNVTDAALGDASSIVLEAKSIGLSQIGVGSDATTRELQAAIIDSMIKEMIGIGNRSQQGVHLFGGAATGKAPFIEVAGGWQYIGEGEGLTTDLGMSHAFPLTVSGEKAFGAVSARVEGERDLDPGMSASTRLQDLNGARGLGVTPGALNVDVDGTVLNVDLSDAHSVQDVIDALTAAIQDVDGTAVVQIDPITQNRFEIIPGGATTIAISDGGADAVAADLGINQAFTAGSTTGQDVDPKLTELTPIENLTGVSVPLGTIRLSNGSEVRDLDLSGAETVRDIIIAVEALNIGIKVEINDDQDRLNFVNTVSGASMSIGEVGGGETATELGVRSLAASTDLADFNNGLGVQILSGATDPLTGDPAPAKDLDFRVTLKNGTTVDVDLAGAESVQDVLDAINAAAAAEGVAVPGDFEAHLAADGNGIALTDNTAGTTTSVTALNGSFAAKDLGILGSTESATFVGEDRATVAVDSVISHLIALRDALKADDESGISLATGKLDLDIDRLAQVRAEVGSRSRRVQDATFRQEDLQVMDMNLKSQLQDLDFTEAAIRFTTLQQQLQAALQTTSRATAMSLLDFLR